MSAKERSKPRFAEAIDQFAGAHRRLEIDRDRWLRHFPQCASEGVNCAAFEAVRGDQKLSGGLFATRTNDDILDRFSFGFAQKGGRPIDFPSAIRWGEGSDLDGVLFQDADPFAIRTRVRPGSPAKRED